MHVPELPVGLNLGFMSPETTYLHSFFSCPVTQVSLESIPQ